MDYIAGRVTGASASQKIVLYAQSVDGVWWIQPFTGQPFTSIEPDSTWKNSTHLGTHYAALLVQPGYAPPLRTTSLPPQGKSVVAISVVTGQGVLAPPKTLHFSGYDWSVRAAGSQRGGQFNSYDPTNAWTDQNGYLHLRMGVRNGSWTCAELSMTKSLGFGSYKFTVQDSAHLPPTAVIGMYTWDEAGAGPFHNEIDIELSRWGNATGMNAQYVIQPFYIPQNVFRFAAPAGVVTYAFRWEPGSLSFNAYRGSAGASNAGAVSAHTFTSGIPTAATETVHVDLYDFHHSSASSQQPVEVVIEKFEFLP
jgi:hypothetical protein